MELEDSMVNERVSHREADATCFHLYVGDKNVDLPEATKGTVVTRAWVSGLGGKTVNR